MIKQYPPFKHRAARFLLISTLLSLIGLILPLLLLFGDTLFLRSSVIWIPDLTGAPLTEADSLDASVFQRVTTEQYSDLPRGTVIAQDPPAGSRRKAVRGKRFVTLTLSVSRGPAITDLTSVIGLPEEQARATLQNRRTSPVSDYVYHTAPAGTVIDQTPKAGTTVRHGEAVRLTVSRGPLLRRVTLPDLSGLTAVEAESLLNAVGLRVKSIVEREDGNSEENRVTAQDPLPGTTLTTQSGVTLVVAVSPPESSKHEPDSAPGHHTDLPPEESTETEPIGNEETSSAEATTDEVTPSPEELLRSILDRIEQRFR